MLKVDRAFFVRPQDRQQAYCDYPLNIGYNATISAPHMHAYCLEWLEDSLQPGCRVLDVGSGSGYLCAVFYELGTKVVGVDHIPELCQFAVSNLS
jgi:protein-L-isoaspartate(D-aspartate) O-methyltransferase